MTGKTRPPQQLSHDTAGKISHIEELFERQHADKSQQFHLRVVVSFATEDPLGLCTKLRARGYWGHVEVAFGGCWLPKTWENWTSPKLHACSSVMNTQQGNTLFFSITLTYWHSPVAPSFRNFLLSYWGKHIPLLTLSPKDIRSLLYGSSRYTRQYSTAKVKTYPNIPIAQAFTLWSNKEQPCSVTWKSSSLC